jgi:hypothetical protein
VVNVSCDVQLNVFSPKNKLESVLPLSFLSVCVSGRRDSTIQKVPQGGRKTARAEKLSDTTLAWFLAII